MTENVEAERQRSTSAASLHTTFKAHNVSTDAYSSLPSQQRRPLRALNDNANFLRSPGPLESMLKTTTETGDIGLFTIKPAVLPATYHAAPRPRPGLADAQLLQASRSRLLQNEQARDDRRRLPSHYRDTTSEIISLYGSDTQPSYSRSLSSSNEDGWRSYSMTTSSSRQMSHQKSSATLPNHSSLASLQRPRSPFPYPTRLKRPGIRPASPALMENGCVDYTKMVELDRVSYVRLATLIHLHTRANMNHRGRSMDRIVQPTLKAINVRFYFIIGLKRIGQRYHYHLKLPRGICAQAPIHIALELPAPTERELQDRLTGV